MTRLALTTLGSLGFVVAAAGPGVLSASRGRRDRRRVAPLVARTVRRAEPWFPSLRRIGDTEIVVVSIVGVLAGLVLAPLLLAGPLGLGFEAVRRERRTAAQRTRDLVDALPEMIDHLGLAVGAGLTLPVALRQVRRWLVGPIRELVDESLTRLDAGASLVDTLGHLGRGLPDTARRPVVVIVAATCDGAPLGQSLARAADEARHTRRREAEARARRLPVLMLLPLVLCVLPAFVLLTLVPLVVGSLDGLAVTNGFPAP